MAIIEQGRCRITGIGSNGLGFAKTTQCDIELPYTIPGELVEFERHSYRNQTNAITKNIVEESNSRIKPECQYFGACGGCMMQHLSNEAYRDFKGQIMKNLLVLEGLNTSLDPVIFLPPNIRRRANLQCIKKNDKVFLGFFRFHSHQIINIDACIALRPRLSELIEPVKELMHSVLTDKQKAQIFLNEVSNGVDLVIDIQDSAEDLDYQSIVNAFVQNKDITRLQILVGGALAAIYCLETPYIIFGDIRVETKADCFLQSSFEADQVLQELVTQYVGSDTKINIADLFCGRGTFTLPLSHRFMVDGFESDEDAVRALSRTATRNIEIKLRDLYEEPVTREGLKNTHAL